MQRWIAGIVLLVSILAGPASAQTLYIPASANVEGANETRWRTDLQVKSLSGEPGSFSIELLESRKNNSDPRGLDFTVGAGESLRLANIIDTEFGFTGTAALRITTTEGPIQATSRTFNDAAAGTYGQTVPALGAADAMGFGDQATLILLSRSPDPSTGFRTNIGLVNLTGWGTGIDIDLSHADGSPISTLSYQLKPFEYRQINDAFKVAGATDVEDGVAVVRTTDEDGRFIAYASVVDNGSGDAVFIPGSTDVAVPTPSADRLVVFEALMRPG